MEVKYRRTAEGSFMLLEGELENTGYEEQMLKGNDIPQLLGFFSLELNDRTQLWYGINGMRSFRDVVISEGITEENLYGMLTAIRDAICGLSKFLINEERLLILPDSVFFSKRNEVYSAGLCYCPLPHENSLEQYRELMRFVIGEVDHSKEAIMNICYELFAVTERKTFSLYDLIEKMEELTGASGGYDNLGTYDANKCATFGVRDNQASFGQPDRLNNHTSIDTRMERAGIDFPNVYEAPEEHSEEEPKAGFISKIKTKLMEKLPKFMTGRERFLPEKKGFCDIEFDEVTPEECGTMLLSENNTGCSGKLLYEGGGRGGRDIDIVKTPFSIGSKAAGNDAVISSEAVSRYHARIIKKNGSYFISDLNSKNGTSINGQLLAYHEEKKLCRMDMVAFADVVYRVV